MTARHDIRRLARFAASLFERSGMPADRARTVARLLIDAAMMAGQRPGGRRPAGGPGGRRGPSPARRAP